MLTVLFSYLDELVVDDVRGVGSTVRIDVATGEGASRNPVSRLADLTTTRRTIAQH
ncbi:hypothetical protein [Nocardia sp. CDC160]|uniref:hypothetical protein n=1 Tax=Nocardia sp. CDC160 TaxID=3112166 RepID=UPI002DBAC109|nr:hypothetical protein [Nocardia sp. CDC160]MEC3919234.1 hypothetical protein [Nocardia sp. CDC160]